MKASRNESNSLLLEAFAFYAMDSFSSRHFFPSRTMMLLRSSNKYLQNVPLYSRRQSNRGEIAMSSAALSSIAGEQNNMLKEVLSI
jgi:hypothetical protein